MLGSIFRTFDVEAWVFAIMSFTEVTGRYNGPALEEEVLEFWREKKIFDQTLKQSEGGPLFTFNEGPPTANGKPGIHHVLARAFKDAFPRYKTMRGYHVPRKAGWDTHGLPVEHEIEKELGIFDKKEIEEKVGIAEFTLPCRESMLRYNEEQMRATGPAGAATHIAAGSNFEEVLNNRAWFCGTPQDTVAYLQELQDKYPGLEHIILGFPMGVSTDQFKDQLTCFAEELIPAFKTTHVSV